MNDTSITEEFCQESAIAQDVFDCAVSLVPDIEIDSVTKEVTGTPLYDLLDWKYTRFGHQAKPNLIGAFFLQESGSVWQAKVFGQDAGKRSGRYYAPKGIGDKVYFPPVPQRVRELIAQKYGLREPKPTESFWEWVSSHPQIPITLTEGGKKALAAISQGEVAVSLYGCLCGALSMSSEGNPTPNTLSQELQPLAANSRPITIAFDQDIKPKAKQSVAKGTRRLGAALAKFGASVRVAQWDANKTKGLDELIAAGGSQLLETVLGSAIPFEQWKHKSLLDLGPYVSLRVNERYLTEELVPPPEAQIIGIKSAKGTGKTQWLTEQVSGAIAAGQRSLVATHRIQLAKELCHRFGIDHIEEIRDSQTGGILGCGVCIDWVRSKTVGGR